MEARKASQSKTLKIVKKKPRSTVAKKRQREKYKLKRQRQQKELKLYQRGLTVIFLILIGCSLWFLITMKAHRVVGHSMEPALSNQDYLFVRKGAIPKRYSLITFEPKGKTNDSYIKRVIGVPGDTIWLDNNTLYLNHQMKAKQIRPQVNSHLAGEELPDGTLKIWVTEEVAKALYRVKKIPEETYFVLGDNRNHSTDSRQLGLISKKDIEGVVKFRYYPFSKLGKID